MNTAAYQQEARISGDSDEDTELLRKMAGEVRAYLGGFRWCPPIKTLYLAGGVGGMVGLFLAELERPIDNQDNFLWVVVGDLPSAYLVTDSSTPKEALETYCSLMHEWARAVKSEASLDNVFPVDAEPTRENAEQLMSRMSFLRREIIPSL
jgi:hypothetical protein